MLQQTRVETVVEYYLKWMRLFPDIAALAAASPDEVLFLKIPRFSSPLANLKGELSVGGLGLLPPRPRPPRRRH